MGGPCSEVGMATGYGLDGPGIESWWGARFSAPIQTGPGAHPASCTIGTGSFPGVKSGQGVMLTPHPLLVPWSRKGGTIPLLPLWAVWPEQSLSACTRVHFTFTLLVYGILKSDASPVTTVPVIHSTVPQMHMQLCNHFQRNIAMRRIIYHIKEVHNLCEPTVVAGAHPMS